MKVHQQAHLTVNSGPRQSDAMRPAASWRASKGMALGEFAVVALIFFADHWHLVPLSKTPFLFVVGWISLRLRGAGWRSVGFTRYRNWGITLGIGIAAGALTEAFQLLATQPLLVRLTGKQPDLHDFRMLTGNVKLALLGFAFTWTLAAFGEEMVWRGYLMNRIADLGNCTRRAWICSLIAVSIVFGTAHAYQGITGMVEEGAAGLFLGVIYLYTGRNLAVPIIAHGIQDTIDVVLIFFGKYPGM
jgi:membrane protease YdiL (CAAX protease family)